MRKGFLANCNLCELGELAYFRICILTFTILKI